MKKIAFILSLIMLIIVTSCSQPDSSLPQEKVNLTVEAYQIPAKTILPTTPTPDLFRIELLQNEEIKKESENSTGLFTLTDVNVGTYVLKVVAYADTAKEKPILSKEQTITIKPNQENKFIIVLDYIKDGTGTMKVRISWEDITEGNQVYEAISEYKSLGFRAIYSDTNTPVNGSMSTEALESSISWASDDDIKNGYMDYIEDGLEPTTGREIYFEIYTKIGDTIQKIAETFHSVVQIYVNLESAPDGGDANNFKLNSDNIISYLFNVTDAKAVPATGENQNPSNTLSVSWTNPTFPDEYYPIKVTITAVDNSTSSTVRTITSKEYTKDDAIGSEIIEGLSSSTTYSLYFQTFTEMGFSDNTRLIDAAQPKVDVTDILFSNDFAKSYVMGDSVTLAIEVQPSTATNDGYTLTVNGIEQTNLLVSFPVAGDYVIKAESKDNSSIYVEHTATVRLAKPQNVEASANDAGSNAVITWNLINKATSYDVYRSVDDGDAAFLKNVPSNSAEDDTIATGHSYAYYVIARMDDEKFDSDISDPSNSISVNEADISITVPEIESVDFNNFLAKALENSVLDLDAEDDELKIELAESISNVKKYKWVLNKTTIKEGAFADTQTITIKKGMEGLYYGASYETTNSLMLVVTTNSGNVFSTTGYFKTFTRGSGSPGTIIGFTDTEGKEIKDGTTIYYGEPIELSVKLEGNTYYPSIEWDTNNPEVISVDDNGKITSHKRGDATITASLESNSSITYSIKLKSYVPVASVTITPPHTEMILSGEAFPGVEIKDASYTTMTLSDYMAVTDKVGDTVTDGYGTYTSTLEWTVADTNALTIDPNTGKITTGTTANTGNKVTVMANDRGTKAEVGSVAMNVLKVDILYKEKDQSDSEYSTITGDSFLTGTSGDFDLLLHFSDNFFSKNNWNATYSSYWCFGDENNPYDSSHENFNRFDTIFRDYFEIKNNSSDNNFSASLTRRTNTKSSYVYAIIQKGENNVVALKCYAKYGLL